MDTVPICVGCRPVRRGEVVRSANPNTGLGADDRAGCAVVLNTALEIVQENLPSATDFFGDDNTSIFEDDINRLAAAGITQGCNPPANTVHAQCGPPRTLARHRSRPVASSKHWIVPPSAFAT